MQKTHNIKPESEDPRSPAATRRGQGRLIGGCLITLTVAILVSLAVYALLVFSGGP